MSERPRRERSHAGERGGRPVRPERPARRDRHDGPGRRTQAERSAETTAKLLDATAACLAELGYGHTSTTEICRRAGVSRGAMLHHFPSKAVLVAAACEHIFNLRVAEFREQMTSVPDGQDRIDVAIDTLWTMFQGETFAAWYELVTAGRTDADLRPHVGLVAARMRETTVGTWLELFDGPADDDPAVARLHAAAPTMLFAVLDGLAVTRMTGMPGAEAEAQMVLDQVKLAANALRSPRTTPPGGSPR